MKLIVGKKYRFKNGHELFLEYDGEDCCGDFCTSCEKELKKGFSFADKMDGNPHIRKVYGTECVKKVLDKITNGEK